MSGRGGLYSLAATIGATLRRAAGPGINAPTDQNETSVRAQWFAVLEHYYYNTVFEDAQTALWARYKHEYRLPRNIRSLFNCTRRAVDWYPGALYPGTDSDENLLLPWNDETQESNPLFVAAAEQAMAWGNWESEQYAWVRQGANLGVAMVAIVDDVERGKVYPELIHPSIVTEIELDPQGHIDLYTIEVGRKDTSGNRYTYKKTVTKEGIWTYKDDRLFDYDGQGAERANPYGFVPAVWTKHSNGGGPWGTPVIGATVSKLESLNGSASSIHDYILRFSEQGAIFSTAQAASSIQRILKGGATYSLDEPNAPREEVRIFKGPEDLKVHRLMENLGLGEGITFLEKLIQEIEEDIPEITVERKVIEMSSATGATITRALTSVAKRHREAMSNYDRSLLRICQQAVAIGGWRLAQGAWSGPGGLTRAQQAFEGFGLESYAAGLLEGRFEKRPLLAETEEEKVAAIAAKETIKSRQGLIELYGEKEGNRVYEERKQQSQEDQIALGRAFNAAGAA